MKRIFASLIIVAAFPLLASLTHNKSDGLIPFATIAFAGHVTTGGGYCQCGVRNCICDPGELPGGTEDRIPPGGTNTPTNQVTSTENESPDLDLGSCALMLALALLLWVRMRA